jgi:hypothetical protein
MYANGEIMKFLQITVATLTLLLFTPVATAQVDEDSLQDGEYIYIDEDIDYDSDETVEESFRCFSSSGYCDMDENGGLCICTDGEMSSWGDREELLLRASPTAQICEEKLIEVCGDSSAVECDEETLSSCIDMLSYINEACSEQSSEQLGQLMGDGNMAQELGAGLCCENYEVVEQGFALIKFCLQTMSCGECVEFFAEEILEEEESSGLQTVNETTDDDNLNGTSSGCSIATL